MKVKLKPWEEEEKQDNISKNNNQNHKWRRRSQIKTDTTGKVVSMPSTTAY